MTNFQHSQKSVESGFNHRRLRFVWRHLPWLISGLLCWLCVAILYPPANLDRITLAVLDCGFTNSSTVMTVQVTNNSSVILLFSSNPPLSEVQCRTADQDSIAKIQYFSKASLGYVMPGDTICYKVMIDQKPEVFRVTTSFLVTGVKGRVNSLLFRMGLSRAFIDDLYPILKFLPEGDSHYVQISSEEATCP